MTTKQQIEQLEETTRLKKSNIIYIALVEYAENNKELLNEMETIKKQELDYYIINRKVRNSHTTGNYESMILKMIYQDVPIRKIKPIIKHMEKSLGIEWNEEQLPKIYDQVKRLKQLPSFTVKHLHNVDFDKLDTIIKSDKRLQDHDYTRRVNQ